VTITVQTNSHLFFWVSRMASLFLLFSAPFSCSPM
jgi:hypothetical protein